MSRDYESRRRGGNGSGSSKMRMDTNSSQSRPHGESSSKRKEIDNLMRKARESQSSYWNKKLLEVEERDPNRWRHSGYKELYVGGGGVEQGGRGHPRSPRSPRPRTPPRSPRPRSPRPRSPRPRSPRSPRDRSHTRGRAARSPSSGSTCSDGSCSVCSPRERRRQVPASRSRSRSMTPPVRSSRAPNKEVVPSGSRAPPQRQRPRSPPQPRPRTPPMAPQPQRHQKEYNKLKEMKKRKEKPVSRVPEDPRIPDGMPMMHKRIKVEKHTGHGDSPPIIHHPRESSPSEDSDSSSNASHVGPPKMTLSERFGKMAQWSVDRRDMENMRITKDGENAMKVVIEGEERIARLGYDSPPPGHYPESLLTQGPRGLECWDDVRVRYDYYKARGYLRDLSLDDYVKWEEWWYKYQEWLEAERYYEQWATSRATGGGGGRKRRGRRNNANH
ncbi:serine/arginine repetitive matrix protein 2-like [Leptopilina heterotoma]|uniref:serine/arginine repetitive matrix protein 2-like n=1 Tax=Leptopilina heterotoma TaxID=63436 RepID=UPI001CA8C0B9|nr:serine/arginine repetitive matrix protein 2-like [Leptopilina heterotoma]XP_043470085.1 serine/arginine repetitive matrix protein 2-like [Leptopilina heterotoma]